MIYERDAFGNEDRVNVAVRVSHEFRLIRHDGSEFGAFVGALRGLKRFPPCLDETVDRRVVVRVFGTRNAHRVVLHIPDQPGYFRNQGSVGVLPIVVELLGSHIGPAPQDEEDFDHD